MYYIVNKILLPRFDITVCNSLHVGTINNSSVNVSTPSKCQNLYTISSVYPNSLSSPVNCKTARKIRS